jgi:beta-lactam-binding protein with PASTA domain
LKFSAFSELPLLPGVHQRNANYNLAMRNLLRLAWMALLLLIVALASALITMRLAIHGGEVRVPDLGGKSPAEARQVAEAIGISSQVERQFYSSTIPEGRVLSQVPEPGTTVRRGWLIRLAVSLGPQRVTIPQVVAESERAAVITIEQRGLQLGAGARFRSPDAPAGYVMGQDPPHDATKISAPKLNLLVADDATPEQYVTPSFVGQSLGSVTNGLRDAGFSVGKVILVQPQQMQDAAPSATGGSTSSPASPGETVPSAGGVQGPSGPSAAGSFPSTPLSPASIIVSQDPAPGRKIAAGSVMNFVVR